MTVTAWVGGWYRGLSGDTKPNHAGLSGWNFLETDTGKIYYHNGSAWSQIAGIGNTYKYTIYEDGANYKALNNDTHVIDSSNSNPTTVIQAAIDAVNTAGGGSIFFRGDTIYSGVTGLVPKSNVCLIGEDKTSTVLKNTTSTSMIDSAGQVTNFGMMHLTLLDDAAAANTAELLDFNGTQDCYFYDNIFKRTNTPSGGQFLVYFGDGGKTQINLRLKFMNNYLSGFCNQDMLGSGENYYCDFSHNGFYNGNAQGIAFNVSVGSHYDNNIFYNVESNIIGAENTCRNNTYNDNIGISSGMLKMSQNSQSGNLSIANVCNGNVLSYGDSGIELGQGQGDIVTNNIVYRTKRTGMMFTGDHCTIANNHFIETNYNNHNMTIGTDTNSGRPGGIEFINNTNWNANNRKFNKIHDNIFQSTNVAFTVPTGYRDSGTSQTGNTGGIMVGTTAENTEIYNNTFDLLVESGNKVKDHGINTKVWNNQGYNFENIGIETMPSKRKTGVWIGVDVDVWSGLFAAGLTDVGMTGPSWDNTHGPYMTATTGATAGNVAGWRASRKITSRALRPRIKAKFQLSQDNSASQTRLFIGLRNDCSNDPSNDNDPLNAEAGFMLGFRSTDTVFQQVSNDVNGGSYFTNISGNPAIDTGVHTIEIWADSYNNRWAYKFDNGNPKYETNTDNMPGANDQLAPMFMIATTTGAKAMKMFYYEIQTD